MPAGRRLENWLDGYRFYTEGQESPPIFHLWVALGTIAAAAQRKIKMDAGYYDIHTNLFIVLVSPAGRSRKTTALKIGKGLLAGATKWGAKINFTSQASSVAGLVQQFLRIQNKDHQSLTAYSYELGSLLGTKSVEMTDFLTDIYDCNPDWDKQTVSRGLEKIERPWFNLLGATTPQWMGDNLPKTAIEGGFVSRTIFIYEDKRLRFAFPRLTDEQKAYQRLLMEDLAHIATLEGSFVFDPEAREFYQHWYEDPERERMESDYRIAGFYERKHVHLLKIAMALALAEGDRLVLETRHLRAAISLLNETEPGLRKAFRAVGKNIHGTTIERIKDTVQQHRAIPYKKLLALFIADVGKEDFDKLLLALTDMGDVQTGRIQGVYCIVDARARPEEPADELDEDQPETSEPAA